MVTATARRIAPYSTDSVMAAVTGTPVNSKSAVAIGQFRVKNRWIGGASSRSTILRGGAYIRRDDIRPRGITIESGAEQPAKVDGEFALHPVEFMLHGLAASVTEAISREADLRGVELRGVQSNVEAQFEKSLFTGELKECKQVQVKVLIDCDEPQQKVQEIFIAAVDRSPAFTMLGKSAPVIFGLVDERGVV
jgi:uncharacterized OsmC-like protein